MPRPRDDEDDDDRPRRRRYEDEGDEDGRPQPRKKKRKKPAGPPVGLIVGGVVGGLALLGLIAVVAYLTLGGGAGGRPGLGPGRGPAVAGPGITPGDQVRMRRGEPTLGPGITVSDRPYVTLANLRKVTVNGRAELELSYTLGDVTDPQVSHVLCVRSGDHQGASRFEVTGARNGLFKVTSQLAGGYAGPVDAWVETRQNRTAVVVSNVVSVD